MLPRRPSAFGVRELCSRGARKGANAQRPIADGTSGIPQSEEPASAPRSRASMAGALQKLLRCADANHAPRPVLRTHSKASPTSDRYGSGSNSEK